MPTPAETPATKSDIAEAVKEMRSTLESYSRSAAARAHHLEVRTSNVDTFTAERLAEIERRMTEFWMRLLALESRH